MPTIASVAAIAIRSLPVELPYLFPIVVELPSNRVLA
jgi:hypothetical protein